MNFRGFSWCRKVLHISLLTILFLFYLFPPEPQQTEAAIDGTWYFNDEHVAPWGSGKAIYCLATDDCKMVYYSQTYESLKFFDCSDATCSTGTTTILDGTTGCVITNCDSGGDTGEAAAIFCVATDDCKITYYDRDNSALLFIDCDNSACSSGTRTILDGNTGCPITNCSTSAARGDDSDIYCISSTDCRISYDGNGMRVIDCDNSTCSSGTSTLLDYNSGCSLTSCNSSAIPVLENTIHCISATDCKIAYHGGTGAGDLKFADCSNATCSTGQARILDGNTGCVLTGCNTSATVGGEASIYCVATDDCKIAYSAINNDTVRFADCSDATCSGGTTTLLDGDSGCSLTNCSTTENRGDPSIYCSATDDCKVTYQNWEDYGIHFADCSNAACSSGTTSPLDGLSGCTLTGCKDTNVTEFRTSIFCISTSDCKVSYYEWASTNLGFADCGNATCTSGQIMTVDGHFMTQTEGDGYNPDGYFGELIGGKYSGLTVVTRDTFPNGSDTTLGSGTYTLRFQYANNLGVGDTLDWTYEVGYCSVSDNCATKTPVVTSSSQQITDSLFSPIDIDAIAGSSLVIPGPNNSKRIYVDMEVTNVSSFSYVQPALNSDAADFADTFISIPVGGSSPQPTPTPSSGSSTGTPGTPPGSCTEAAPSKAPVLYQINTTSTNATLYFVPAGSPTSRHRISYGTSASADQHSITTSSSSNGAMEFTVQELLPNTRYYFKVRGENDCQPGEWSSILSNSPTSSQTPTSTVDEEAVEEIEEILPDLEISNVEVQRREGKIIITWTTNIPSSSNLRLGPTEEDFETISSSILGTSHIFEIEDPDPTSSLFIQAESVRGDDIVQINTQADSVPVPSISQPKPDSPHPLTDLNNSVVDTFTAIIQGLSLSNSLSYQENSLARFTSNLTGGLTLLGLFYTSPLALKNLLIFLVGMVKDAPIIILKISSLIPHLFGRKKKQYHWGTVFDSLTKQPIDPAIITLLSQSQGFIPRTVVTNFEGHFGFLVDIGKYILSVKKSDYVFPSRILAGRSKDGERDNLYFGDEIEVKDPSLIHVDIPMDPVRFNWNQANKPIKYHPLRVLLKNQTLLLISWLGLGLSILTYILDSTPTNLLLLLLYIVIITSSLLTTRHKKWGTVYDEKTRTIQPLVTVQVVRMLDGNELEGPKCITDHLGRYFFIVGPGTHFVQVYREENGVRTMLKKTDQFNIKRGDRIYNKDIRI